MTDYLTRLLASCDAADDPKRGDDVGMITASTDEIRRLVALVSVVDEACWIPCHEGLRQWWEVDREDAQPIFDALRAIENRGRDE